MGIKVIILHPSLQQLTHNLELIGVNGHTVGECLNHLVKQFPGLEKGLFDRYGQLLNYVCFFVNGKGAYPTNPARPLKDGDELTISVLLAGG